MPKRDADRATTIALASACFRAIIGSNSYDVFFIVPGSSGTIPDVQLVDVGIRLSRAVPFPSGMPIFRERPGESDPGYGEPIPLDGAIILSNGTEGPTSSVVLDVDLESAKVLVVEPHAHGPDG